MEASREEPFYKTIALCHLSLVGEILDSIFRRMYPKIAIHPQVTI